MEKSTIIYQIGEIDNKNKLENIFKELHVNYQLDENRFMIYIPDVVVANPVIKKKITRLEEELELVRDELNNKLRLLRRVQSMMRENI